MARQKIVITIGDTGALLAVFTKEQLTEQVFLTYPTIDDSDLFHKIIDRYKHAEIILLIDVVNQRYDFQQLPIGNTPNIRHVVNQQLLASYPDTPLNSYLSYGKNEHNFELYDFTFISVPMDYPIVDWLELINTIPNPIAAIYTLALESFALKNIITPAKKIYRSRFTICMSHQKVSGIRQTIFYNHKLLRTKMIRVEANTHPEVLAGIIEQEASRNIATIQQELPSNAEPIALLIGMDASIHHYIEQEKYSQCELLLLTPQAISRYFTNTPAYYANEPFMDGIYAHHTALYPSRHRLEIPAVKKINRYHLYKKIVLHCLWIILPLMVIYTIITIDQIRHIQDQIRVQQEKLDQLKDVYQSVLFSYNKNNYITQQQHSDPNVTLYRTVMGQPYSALEFMFNFSQIKQHNLQVRSIEWAPNHRQKTSKDGSAAYDHTITIDIDYQHSHFTMYELFQEFDYFIEQLEQRFNNYRITYNRLPYDNQQTNGTKIPITITMYGVNDE